MIIQPAGAATPMCCFVPNVLSQTLVQTVALGGGVHPSHDGNLLSLDGLGDREHFRAADVRIKNTRAAPTDSAPAQQRMDSCMQRTLEEMFASCELCM